MIEKRHKSTSSEGGWLSQLIKLIIMGALIYAVYYMVINNPRERKLVCDDTPRVHSLTQFGTCHKE